MTLHQALVLGAWFFIILGVVNMLIFAHMVRTHVAERRRSS